MELKALKGGITGNSGTVFKDEDDADIGEWT